MYNDWKNGRFWFWFNLRKKKRRNCFFKEWMEEGERRESVREREREGEEKEKDEV